MIFRKSNTLIKIINNTLIDLPTPSNINYLWNFGSLLGICLIIQILSGFFLSIHYTCDHLISFSSISHIIRDVNYGWLFRNSHANGASFFFILIYIHIRRGLYFSSFYFIKTWFSGILILLLLIRTAFLGYILPWGQISFWGATVITNLLRAFPLLGNLLTSWIWGGFSINNATLTRFYSIHFLLPFILLVFVIIHIFFLHETGSNNPLGISKNIDKIPFYPFFFWKDILGVFFLLIIFITIILINPNLFSDPENYIPANSIITPPHIQPEWYFLFAYAILRSIPNKLGGVLGLLISIIILISLPFSIKNKYNFSSFYFLNKILYWIFINSFIILTFFGACPVEAPFIWYRQIFAFIYFSFFLLKPIFSN